MENMEISMEIYENISFYSLLSLVSGQSIPLSG